MANTNPESYTYVAKYWSFQPAKAICYNPVTMHKKPDDFHAWRVWGIYIPIDGIYIGDYKMLDDAINIMEQGKAQPTAGSWYLYPGGLFYRYWVTDADIRAGAKKLVNLACDAIRKDYYVDKINHDICEIQRLKELDRRTGRVDQSGPSGNLHPTPPLLMPRYQPSLHFPYPASIRDAMT